MKQRTGNEGFTPTPERRAFGVSSASAERGFTLIEMLLVIFLSSMLLLGLFSLYEWHGKMYSYQQAMVRVTESGRQSMQALQLYVTQAYRVVNNYTSPVDGTVHSSGPTTLVLQVPAINSGGIALAGKWDYVVFYLSGTDLNMQVFADPASSRPGGTRLLTERAASLTFTYDNANFSQVHAVTAELTTAQQVRSQQVTQQLEQNFILRNY